MKKIRITLSAGRRSSMTELYRPTDENGNPLVINETTSSDELANIVDDMPIVQYFVHPINENGAIDAYAENMEDDVIFDDTIKIEAFDGNPSTWDISHVENRYITDALSECIAHVRDNAVNEFDMQEFCDNIICKSFGAPIDENCGNGDTLIVRVSDLYAIGGLTCEIDLDDDEEFDAKEIHLFCTDFDGYSPRMDDSIAPLLQYKNKVYDLYQEDWETHYEYYSTGKVVKSGKNSYPAYMDFN